MKIHFVLTLFSAILRTSIAQGDTYLCNICGEGKMIGNIGGVVVIDGLGNRTCTDLNDLGLSGVITEAQCDELSPYAQTPCDCTTFVCPICGEDGSITIENGILDIPGDDVGQTTCQAVNDVALSGGINETFCPTVQAVAEDPCGCQNLNTPSLTPTVEPTLEPTRVPTVDRPPLATAAPVPAPIPLTDAPSGGVGVSNLVSGPLSLTLAMLAFLYPFAVL